MRTHAKASNGLQGTNRGISYIQTQTRNMHVYTVRYHRNAWRRHHAGYAGSRLQHQCMCDFAIRVQAPEHRPADELSAYNLGGAYRSCFFLRPQFLLLHALHLPSSIYQATIDTACCLLLRHKMQSSFVCCTRLIESYSFFLHTALC